jgi:ElaB/YqjD/DUF883 family membrane-anchored ribosome-binding protein
MFRQSGYSRAITADIGEIDQRLRALEKTLERLGGRASASAGQAADRLGEAVASALSTIADRFRNGAGSIGDEAAKLGNRLGGEATKLGDVALRRLSHQVEHRPLVTLAVAVGVGILVGMATHRR